VSEGDREIAKRTPNLHPMPDERVRLFLNRVFTSDEYKQISFGFIPTAMEDKWLIFLEDDWLYFHRSWTGHCIYQLRLESNAAGYFIAEAWVNRDQSQYRNSDNKYDEELLSFLTDNFLLDGSNPFPIPNNLPPNTPKGLYQHHVSGSGYPETEVSKTKKTD